MLLIYMNYNLDVINRAISKYKRIIPAIIIFQSRLLLPFIRKYTIINERYVICISFLIFLINDGINR